MNNRSNKHNSLKSKMASQLFTSQSIHKITQGDFSFLYTLINNYLSLNNHPIKIADIFESTFKQCKKDYKSEYFFKNIVAQKLFLKKHNNNATMITELRVGNNKADCVIVNGCTTCYEIKTKFDSLVRLPEQISTYLKIFEKVYVVCDKSHTQKVISIVPENVGIIELTDRDALIEIRKANKIQVDIDREIMINSLRKAEYVYIAENLSNRKIVSSNMYLFNHCLSIFNQSSNDDIRKLYIAALKKHRKVNFSMLESLPSSLINSAISFKLSPTQQEAFRNILSLYLNKDNLCTSPL